jgi:hypothetical protein
MTARSNRSFNADTTKWWHLAHVVAQVGVHVRHNAGFAEVLARPNDDAGERAIDRLSSNLPHVHQAGEERARREFGPREGEILPFKKAFAHFAVIAGVPVVRSGLWLGKRISVFIGEGSRRDAPHRR